MSGARGVLPRLLALALASLLTACAAVPPTAPASRPPTR